MEFKGGWRIDDSGRALWHQGLIITDEEMKKAYRQNVLVEFIIETSATMGVMVGRA